MTDRTDEEPRPDDPDGSCPGPAGDRAPRRPAAHADRPTAPAGPASVDVAGSPDAGPPVDPGAPAWPPLVHVPDCDRSELLRRIVGG